MAHENLCMYCFEDKGSESICPHCGRDSRAAVPQVQMLPGSLVYHDRFLVGRALGQDATGIVYAAFDTKRENKLRLREYLPRDCAERLNDGTVVPIAGMEDQFDKGLKKLRASVEGVEDPRKRHFFFEENGTAYIAQRKNAAAAGPAHSRGEDDDDEREGGGLKRVGLIVGVCAVLVIAAAAILINMVNGVLDNADDIAQNPTLNPGAVWAPDPTASPTPYVSPTFAALVDPEQSWMDYTYIVDVDKDFQNKQEQSDKNKATPKPTASSGFKTVSKKSSPAEITTLQQRLTTLGWLSYEGINGAYDDATVQAVKDFQQYVNETYDVGEKLTVDGIAGPKTQQWLYGVQAVKPTPQPTPMVTPNPDQILTVDKNSSKTDILAVQRKLTVLGLMKPGTDDGVYGTTTTAAVKQFQQRVNELQGYPVLEITGTVDPMTMAFLNYYVAWWESLQQATATPTPTQMPTPAPTDIPDAPEDELVVDQNSPKESIQYLQQMLIGVGLLGEGSDDGIYGSGTIAAVAKFQEWVNRQTSGSTLNVTGVADTSTLGYLEMAHSNGMMVVPTATPAPTDVPTQAPTAEPTAEPTAVPTSVPTAEPTSVPTPEPTVAPEDNIVVDKDSSKDAIRRLQQMLISVGLLGEGGDDGVYGRGTTGAIEQFQQFVNEVHGENTVKVTGKCDQLTLSYLEQYFSAGLVVVPTQAPTAEPTAVPTAVPTAEPTSVPTSVPTAEPTQEPSLSDIMLAINGAPAGEEVVLITGENAVFDWKAAGDVEGYYVYIVDGSGKDIFTSEATDITQGGFKAKDLKRGEVYTITIGALPAGGGQEDMIWTSARFMVPAESATQAPTSVPTSVPTAEPTNIPAPTDAPTIAPVEVKVAVNGNIDHTGVLEITGEFVEIQWASQGNVDGYYVQVLDQSGEPIVSLANTDETKGTLPVGQLTPGTVYTVAVGALPAGGSEADIIWTSAQFIVPAPATPAPTDAPTPTPAPVIGTIGRVTVAINGNEANGLMQISGDAAQFNWMASGDVQSYSVYVIDASGEVLIALEDTQEMQGMLPVSSLIPGEIYTLRVGVRPVNGGSDSIVWTDAQFTVPVPVTPAPTAEPTVAPVSKPQISIDGTAYSQNGVAYLTGKTAIFTWMADGEVQGYSVYLENSAGQRMELGNTTDTSRTVELNNLPADVYRIHVGAVPAGARSESDIIWNSLSFGIPQAEPDPTAAPTPTDAPNLWPVTLDKNSTAEEVTQVQMKLYELGKFMSADDVQKLEVGKLDQITLNAIAAFQTFMNETYNLELPVIDLTAPEIIIDEQTLTVLNNVTPDLFAN